MDELGFGLQCYGTSACLGVITLADTDSQPDFTETLVDMCPLLSRAWDEAHELTSTQFVTIHSSLRIDVSAE